MEEKQNLEEAMLEMKTELQKNGKAAVSKEVSKTDVACFFIFACSDIGLSCSTP